MSEDDEDGRSELRRRLNDTAEQARSKSRRLGGWAKDQIGKQPKAAKAVDKTTEVGAKIRDKSGEALASGRDRVHSGLGLADLTDELERALNQAIDVIHAQAAAIKALENRVSALDAGNG